jgi:hypothetical protein
MGKVLLSKVGTFLLSSVVLLTLVSTTSHASKVCSRIYTQYTGVPTATAFEYHKQILQSNRNQSELGIKEPREAFAYGSDRKVLRSFESEGLYYKDIKDWFPAVKASTKDVINELFKSKDKRPFVLKRKAAFENWLSKIAFDTQKAPEFAKNWANMTTHQRWQALYTHPDFFSILSLESKSQMFADSIVTFDELQAGPKAPPYITVGDDLGSYEVRVNRAIPDSTQYRDIRDAAESYLDGKIGHQHLFHGWPKDARVREQIAPYYIELLDATTWFLFWRQMRRDPEEKSSILAHQFLGVYATNSLERLHGVVVEGNAKSFNDKFRMIGARSFAPLKDAENQEHVPDWELRGGNKGVKREFMELALESRLVTGDYSGLKDYRNNNFSTIKSIEELTENLLSKSDVEILKKFEQTHPYMEFNTAKTAKNHYRNRFVSPLFDWNARLNMGIKARVLEREQRKYAEGLVEIAREFLKDLKEVNDHIDLGEARQEVVDKVEVLIYKFSKEIRLDLDFERYLTPVPKVLPSVLVASQGAIDINQLPLGIEYSFRFPYESRPESMHQARKMINTLSARFASNYGTKPEPIEAKDGHGHGIAIKNKVVDGNGQAWRVEWDGIQRKYEEGEVVKAWGGHVEVVSPKFTPQTVEGPIVDLYQTARNNNMIPSRAAGGAHMNFDLTQIMQNLPPEQGTRAVLNLVTYFENNQNLILSLWMHPQRVHAAFPVVIRDGFAEKVRDFKGGWKELGVFLYENRYFNVFKGRKPKYVPINLTSLMTDILPKEYTENILDIKNEDQKWFPNFNKVHGRGEMRFFDAPTNEYVAALQIKYTRALFNKSLNSAQNIDYAPKFSADRMNRWKLDANLWVKDVSEHLQELGLDPQEFLPLIWDSYGIQKSTNRYKEFKDFLPSEMPAESNSETAK